MACELEQNMFERSRRRVVVAVFGQFMLARRAGAASLAPGRDRVEIGVDVHVGVLVIVQPAAAEETVIEFEAERFDEVQRCAGVSAEADDRARVGSNLRLDEDDVHGRHRK